MKSGVTVQSEKLLFSFHSIKASGKGKLSGLIGKFYSDIWSIKTNCWLLVFIFLTLWKES